MTGHFTFVYALFMRTVIFIPPLTKISGGLATLYRLATVLHAQGREVCLASLHKEVPGLPGLLEGGIPYMPFQSLQLGPDDLWLVPESHPNAISPGVGAGARVVVYVQNWYYMLSTLPAGVHWQQMPVEFLAVSHPVAWFMQKVLGVSAAAILPPVVAPCFFTERPALPESDPTRPIRVAFMPRKNAALARQMQEVAMAALGPKPGFAVEWFPLHNMTPEQVAAGLASSMVYLASGFPEGFGLPPAEAMAAGCLVVGFTGFGGWEYMRPAQLPSRLPGVPGQSDQMGQFGPSGPLAQFSSPSPPCDLPYSLAPNGFYVADGDTIGGGLALAAALHFFRYQPESLVPLQKAASKAASLFTAEQQSRRVAAVWDGFQGRKKQ